MIDDLGPTRDPVDASDDLDEPAVVLSAEDSEPVELEEGDESELASPPEDWAAEMTESDLRERLEGVAVTDDPKDGVPE